MTQSTSSATPRLTSLSHGGGCGCKIAPGVLSALLARSVAAGPLQGSRGPLGGQQAEGAAWGHQLAPMFKPCADLLVGNETADDAAVYRLNDEQALIATTDFFMPIVDDPYDFGRIAAANALSDVYAMGGTPILALAIVGMPINVLPHEVIADVLRGGESVCAEAGIPVAGGHSIDSVEPIYGLAAMGLVHPKRVKRNADARAGDVLILGKPLGVGILSAALKKNLLDAAGYRAMIEATTRLNTPGAALSELPGVHAITDITGFGLLGHTLEMARGAGLAAHVRLADLPWLDQAQAYAAQGVITGASARNWASYGESIRLGAGVDDTARSLLADPQTSGGLLVACAAQEAERVLDIFRGQGFGRAAVIGEMRAGAPGVHVE
jgi:selenide,water dikinase